jgi:type IV pilus assembly protein PilB
MSDLPSISDLMSKQPADDSALKNKAKKPFISSKPEDIFEKKMGEISQKELETEAMRLAASLGLPHIDLQKFPVSANALKQISKEDALGLGAVCFYALNDEIRLGAMDPARSEVLDCLKSLEENNHVTGGLYVISKASFDKVIKLYDKLPVVEAITKDISIKPEDLDRVSADINDFSSLQSLVEKTSTTDLLAFIIGAALKLDASDVHVETEEKGVVARFRLDGILHDAATIDKEAYRKLVSRIKLISSLKINIVDKPQDGRFSIHAPEGEIDVRVSTLPTVYGESIVLRILRQSKEGLSLDDLGMNLHALELLKKEIERPNGMIITTGPTGSGKTTTLYAIMHILNKPGVKIITLEDPVEYKMEGINQSQIDKSKDYTFAKGLRSILRQDPDIAMVGEIRDLETAEIAIQAALTGHLMLSTLHTNNAAGAIPRFLSMGAKPFLLAPALNAIMGQRLVRILCQKCKMPHVLTEEEKKRVDEIIESMPDEQKQEIRSKGLKFFEAKGCKDCNDLGYKGRVGIYEIFLVGKEEEQSIMKGAISEYDIAEIAKRQGMITMVQDGIIKALNGKTTIDEVFRVTQ